MKRETSSHSLDLIRFNGDWINTGINIPYYHRFYNWHTKNTRNSDRLCYIILFANGKTHSAGIRHWNNENGPIFPLCAINPKRFLMSNTWTSNTEYRLAAFSLQNRNSLATWRSPQCSSVIYPQSGHEHSFSQVISAWQTWSMTNVRTQTGRRRWENDRDLNGTLFFDTRNRISRVRVEVSTWMWLKCGIIKRCHLNNFG